MDTHQPNDLVTRLLLTHVKCGLRAYLGNLTHAASLIDKGGVPGPNSPGIGEHLETLRQYLATNGNVEDDLFLLCFGLTVPVAQRSFREWARKPPEWASMLHVPPAEYTLCAGWYVDEDGQVQDLISKDCFRLCPFVEGTSNPIGIRIPADGECPSCGSRLVHLFDFSRAEQRLQHLGLAESPTTVLCCLPCACHAPVFSRYFADGATEYIGGTVGSEKADAILFQTGSRSLTALPSPRFVCAEPFGLKDATTLGGIPMWLQDAEYPRCIECGRYMTILAQHDNGPLGEKGATTRSTAHHAVRQQ